MILNCPLPSLHYRLASIKVSTSTQNLTKSGDKIFYYSKNLKHKVTLKQNIDLFADYEFTPEMKHRIKSYSSISSTNQMAMLETSSYSMKDDL